ncbi:MAG: polysaccharide deacetylase family protein [Huintestinicola sp.]
MSRYGLKKYCGAAAAVAAVTVAISAGILLCRECRSEYAMALDKTAELPVLMYHSILKDPSRTGEYVITPDEFEKDMAYLSEHGYTAVTSAEIIAFTDIGEPLPEKPVLITFDDGHLNNLTYALPIMEKYDMRGEVNIVGAYTEQSVIYDDHNPYYAYLTWEEISELAASGRMEIGCHTYDMHSLSGRKGCAKRSWETAEEYTAAFSEDIDRVTVLLGEQCGIRPLIFAYPYGYMSEESYDILRNKGYRILLTCTEKTNMLTCSKEGEGELIFLDRYNRSGLMSCSEFMSRYGL